MKSSINKKYEVNEDYFKIIDSGEKAYFLGLMYSDGSVSERSIVIGLQDRDKEILEKFATSIGYTGFVRFGKRRRPQHSDRAVLCVYSRDLVADLTKIGCTRNKTYTLQFPEIPQNLYSHFIRGVFDGDGCIGIYNGNGYFSITGNKHFLQKLNSTLAEKCGIKESKLSRKNKSSELFASIQYSKNSDLIKIREFLYKDCGDIFLGRKKEKFFSIEETVKKTCKICGDKYEAKGLCKACYMKYWGKMNRKKYGRYIQAKNLLIGETIKADTVEKMAILMHTTKNMVYKHLSFKGESKKGVLYSYEYGV